MRKIIISIVFISCLFLTTSVHAGPIKKFFNGGGSIICSLGEIPHFWLVRASRKNSMGIIPGTFIAAFYTIDGVVRGGADMIIPVGEPFSDDCLITRLVTNSHKQKRNE